MTTTAGSEREGGREPTPQHGGSVAIRAVGQRRSVSAALSRTAGLAALFGVATLLIVNRVMVRHQGHLLSWSIAAIVAVLLFIRGVHLGRPLIASHVLVAFVALLGSLAFQGHGHHLVGLVLLAATGMLLMLPVRSQSNPELLPTIARLVNQTKSDVLAPFAMHSTKSYFVEANGRSAIGYRAIAGVAVVGGDPVGDAGSFAAVAEQFAEFCASRGWRIAALGASEAGRELWQRNRATRHIRAVAFGRDVVLDVQGFEMTGRAFRNLRQAVNRTHNAGLTTEVVAEDALDADKREELMNVARGSRFGAGNRGYSMILDHLLDGRTPGLLLVVARDRNNQVVAFQRYATADHGRELSLDVPWRRDDAPNGIDERLTVAMLEWAKSHNGSRISLALAAFPEIFDNENRGFLLRVAYRLIHLGDPLIAVESLYRYLRKFHALGGRRYAMFGLTYAVPAVCAMFILEFVPHRREY